MLSLVVLAALASTALADRSLTINNECSYELWPAVLNTFEDGGYTGSRGWHAAPSSSKTVTLPEKWNGRVWARRGCDFDDSGAGSCLAGDCGGGLQCEDATMGWANLFEINEDSYAGNDFWDISAVPGFTVPMSVVPGDSSCDSVVCSVDLNPSCPEELRVYDTDGTTVITCLSACMAGIAAGENSANCCSGTYNSLDACLSSDVDYYDFFKSGCENAYNYRTRVGSPTVDQSCTAANPSYTITFCPSISGNSSTSYSSSSTAGKSTEVSSFASSSSKTSTTAQAVETTTSTAATSIVEASSTSSTLDTDSSSAATAASTTRTRPTAIATAHHASWFKGVSSSTAESVAAVESAAVKAVVSSSSAESAVSTGEASASKASMEGGESSHSQHSGRCHRRKHVKARSA
ncbi:hypothetical protein JCM8547_001045 [Rhodosporidiobolus lusitaniae]